MSRSVTSSGRNQSLECCRMLAAAAVIQIHMPFAGVFGEVVDCLCRFAVPLFFAVTGYFAFGADRMKLRRRFVHVFELNLLAIVVSLLWTALFAALKGENVAQQLMTVVPGVKALGSWVFMHINPFGVQFWYLTALAVCSAGLWAYTAFFEGRAVDYRPLYAVGVALFVIRFAIADLLRVIGFSIPFYMLRDGLFIGMPMIALGIFLREYGERLMEVFRLSADRLALIFLAGSMLSVLQQFSIGSSEVPFGAVLQAASMLLLCRAHPGAGGRSAAVQGVISAFGFLSTWIFILHIFVRDAYYTFFSFTAAQILGAAQTWLQPTIVFILSLLVSAVLLMIVKLSGALRRRNRR